MTTSPEEPPRGRPLLGAVTALGTAIALAVATAPPAMAHNVLIETAPVEGTTLETQPETVELVFDDYVQDQDDFTQVAVLDGNENAYQVGEPRVEDNTVTQDVEDLPDGDYTVSYRVVSADGHPVDGTFDFTMNTGLAPEDTNEPAQAGEDSGEGTNDGVNGTVLGGLVLFVALALLALLTARNRRRLKDTTNQHAGDSDDDPAR
ncbi:copper resistance protein CopC [Actinobacteria bacterium YIM 96077]|uniref:Copper resistance protein CopC n=1 Tax=Phytoactinopolyspora halophila TaxID=1981511 RepID=A0A329Q9X7_9ACTN|nr:copper resistance CopC family protein [Phytoactinopolyspora halophila]AYY14641.1 copper resistance protein CopC [Actinobacteria bacterium YIM 96077]RAW09205.1 copper resistance protein CopC [Phytoactinopolyspora halophila]